MAGRQRYPRLRRQVRWWVGLDEGWYETGVGRTEPFRLVGGGGSGGDSNTELEEEEEDTEKTRRREARQGK